MSLPRRRFFRNAVLATICLLLGFVGYKQRNRLLNAYYTYCADRLTSDLPYVDRIEVNLLAPVPIDGSGRSDGFPINAPGGRADIIETTTLHSTEARKLAAIWRHQNFGVEYQMLCHDGVYGLRFFHGNALLLETTLCFHCQNFYLPASLPGDTSGWWGFDAESERGRELRTALDALAPYALREPVIAKMREERARREVAAEAASAGQPSP